MNRLNRSSLLLRLFVAVLLILAHLDTKSQALSAYTDYRGYFMAFDKGVVNKLEYLPVNSYKMGSSCIA